MDVSDRWLKTLPIINCGTIFELWFRWNRPHFTPSPDYHPGITLLICSIYQAFIHFLESRGPTIDPVVHYCPLISPLIRKKILMLQFCSKAFIWIERQRKLLPKGRVEWEHEGVRCNCVPEENGNLSGGRATYSRRYLLSAWGQKWFQ